MWRCGVNFLPEETGDRLTVRPRSLLRPVCPKAQLSPINDAQNTSQHLKRSSWALILHIKLQTNSRRHMNPPRDVPRSTLERKQPYISTTYHRSIWNWIVWFYVLCESIRHNSLSPTFRNWTVYIGFPFHIKNLWLVVDNASVHCIQKVHELKS